jgi:hypothetical protein
MDNSKRPLNTDFILNKAEYQGAQILLARENFGCGSTVSIFARSSGAIIEVSVVNLSIVYAPSIYGLLCQPTLMTIKCFTAPYNTSKMLIN